MKELVNSFETSGNGFWITSSSVDTDKIVIANILNKNHWCHYGKVLADANKWSNHENFWPNCKHMAWLIIAKTDFSKGLPEALYLLKRWGGRGEGETFFTHLNHRAPNQKPSKNRGELQTFLCVFCVLVSRPIIR